MAEKAALPQGMTEAEAISKGKWVKVEIYAPTYTFPHMCAGYVYCLQGRRLLDQLNEMFPSALSENKEFLPVSQGELRALRGERRTLRFACLNKSNILFVKEFEGGQTRGISGKPGYRTYPYVPKSPIPVRLYLPFYVVTGRMHCAEGQRVSDVVNLPLRFLPITNVEISPSVGPTESGVGFLAVNKGQIILLEDVEGQPA